MLSGITWTQYLTATAAILVCYYVVILFLFYRNEVSAFLNHRSLVSSESVELPDHEQMNNTLAELEGVVHSIDQVIDQSNRETEKEDLLEQFNQILAGFAGLKVPAWRVAIYNHIISKSAEQCGVTISERELDARG